MAKEIISPTSEVSNKAPSIGAIEKPAEKKVEVKVEVKKKK